MSRTRRARLYLRCILLMVALLSCVFLRSAEPVPAKGEKPDSTTIAQRERLKQLGVERWHAAGFHGRSVKIAILDTGFRGYREHLGKALPNQVAVRSFHREGTLEARPSNHGVMVAELVHVVAPEAELLLANWEPDEPDTFVAAVQWCRDQGARIVNCSVIMPAWSDGEGGGDVHARLANIVGSGREKGDILAFCCAGNLAQRHWAGRFKRGKDGWHEWKQGHATNEVTPWSDERVSIEVCWQSGAVYVLEVIDQNTGKPVGASHRYSGKDRQTMTVRFFPESGHSYVTRLRLVDGSAGSFHLTALGAGLNFATAGGSIPFPGDGAEWLTVGAVGSDGGRVPYSSCGPNSRHPKPDMVALVPFPTACRSTPFSGTSAASPQAAGLAALVWSRFPDWSAQRVREFLCRACEDLGPPGHDAETGFGRIALPAPKP